MKLNPQYMMRTVGTTTVLMNVSDPQKMVKLNEMAALILTKTSEGKTKEEIVSYITKEYDAPAEQVTKDVENTLSQFIRMGIVEA